MKNEVNYLSELVSMQTVTDDTETNGKLIDYLAEYFFERGFVTHKYVFKGHPALVGWSKRANAQSPKVMLAAHADVADGPSELFRMKYHEGKLLGRGVYDMKFAIASYMQLVESLGDTVNEYDFGIMITTDEEYGSRDGVNSTKDLVKMGFRPKVCILPDSTAAGWNIEKLAKGYWRFDLEAFGTATRASKPWEGDSASFKLIPVLDELQKYFGDHGPETDTLNIAAIHGGDSYNMIPEDVIARIEVRFLSDETLAPKQKFIQELVKKHGLSYRERVLTTPAATDLSSPMVKEYENSVEKVTGHKPKGVISHAGTDAQYFNELGIPCIISCPLGGKHHSDEEWLDHDSFVQFVPILRDYLDRVAK